MIDRNISQKIQVLINQFKIRNYEHVISKGKVLLKKNPEYAILYNLIGSAYQNTRDYEEAIKFFKNGLQFDKDNIALMNNLAMANKNLLLYDSAEKIYSNILKINDKYVNAYINLGNLKRDLNQFADAIKLYEKAAQIADKSPIVFYSLALAHQGIGNFDKTIYYSKKTLEIDPNFTRADHLISQSNKYGVKDDHYHNLKDKINKMSTESFEKIDLYFSLAKAEEDLGNIETASIYLIKGNKLKKNLTKYEVTKEIKLLKDIEKTFNEVENKDIESTEDDNIIFILGMPRSGTSLVEQIITSHSLVFGGGELPILSNIIKKKFINEHEDLVVSEIKELAKPEFTKKIKLKYLDFIKNFNFKQKYITDKAPLNFRWIGFIKSIFPNAKIIHCSRDPKNNCLSMFKNLFEGGLNFTYDQEDLVTYYKQYLNLMSFWETKYSGKILSVNYENLVSNSHEEIKNIIKFCDLDWEEECLSFYKNKAPIKIMSTAQARKPIYKSSINAFDKFKNFLTILEKRL